MPKIRYRIADGELLEAAFGEVGTANTGEAVLEIKGAIPDFDLYLVEDGKIVPRAKQEIDDREQYELELAVELGLAKTFAYLHFAKEMGLTKAEEYLTAAVGKAGWEVSP